MEIYSTVMIELDFNYELNKIKTGIEAPVLSFVGTIGQTLIEVQSVAITPVCFERGRVILQRNQLII